MKSAKLSRIYLTKRYVVLLNHHTAKVMNTTQNTFISQGTTRHTESMKLERRSAMKSVKITTGLNIPAIHPCACSFISYACYFVPHIYEDNFMTMSTVSLNATFYRQYTHVISSAQKFVWDVERMLMDSQAAYYKDHGQNGQSEYYREHGYVPNSPQVKEIWDMVTEMVNPTSPKTSSPGLTVQDLTVEFSELQSKISAVDLENLRRLYPLTKQSFDAVVTSKGTALAALIQWSRMAVGTPEEVYAKNDASCTAKMKMQTLLDRLHHISAHTSCLFI